MTAKGLIGLLKQHGTRKVVTAMVLEPKSEALGKQAKLIGSLIDLLERKKILRRGHVVALLLNEEISDE
jgi:hypothetical protein